MRRLSSRNQELTNAVMYEAPFRQKLDINQCIMYEASFL